MGEQDKRPACDTCDSCEADRPTRRRLLETAGSCLAGLVVLLGLPAVDALAMPVLTTTGESIGDERRYPIPIADSVNVDRDAQIILARVQTQVYVFDLTCPHQQAAVKWLPRDNRFQCTKHDSKYRPDGVYMAGRATRNLDRFAVRREGGAVVVDLTRVIRSDQEPTAWAAAFVGVA
jgi:nitrite reductase/ring-hydroxylating ferredoxin subunit